MNPITRFRSTKKSKITHDLHLWVIIVIILACTTLYYAWPYFLPQFKHWLLLEYRYRIIGSFFFIPFLYAVIVFWWQGALIAWSLCIAAIFPQLLYIWPDPWSLLRNLGFSLVPFLIVAVVALELKWREKQRETSAEREEERQLYVSQVLKAQEDERQRIGQELHDDTTQRLLGIANRAQTLASGDYGEIPSEARAHTEWIRDTIIQVYEDARRLSLDLRPSILDNMGLIPALKWLLYDLSQDDNIVAKFAVDGIERNLPSEVEVTLFRIAQEALSNVRHHSQASMVIVNLRFGEKSLKIRVSDNGKGFSARDGVYNLAAEGKLGLTGMQQRAKSLGGTVKVHSEPGKGTLVSVEVKC